MQVDGYAAVVIENVTGSQPIQLQNSVIHDPQGQAIAVKNGSSVSIRSNIVSSSKGHAISISSSSSGNIVADNLVVGCAVNSLLSPSDQMPAGIYATSWNNTFR